MRTMKETTCTSWSKMMQIPTRAKTTNGIAKAIKNYTGSLSTMRESDHKYVWATYMKEKGHIAIHMNRHHAAILKLGFILETD